jgi:hypothetical protein
MVTLLITMVISVLDESAYLLPLNKKVKDTIFYPIFKTFGLLIMALVVYSAVVSLKEKIRKIPYITEATYINLQDKDGGES